MGDECTCEKCQVASVYARDAVVWPVGRAETTADAQGRSPRDQYVIIGERGISLRQQTSEM